MVLKRSALNALWVLGFRPAASDYSNIFDSFVHKDDELPSDVVTVANIAALPNPGSTTAIYVVIDSDGGGTLALRVWDGTQYVNPLPNNGGGGYATAVEVRDALQTLAGVERLSATAIKDLPVVPATRPADEITVTDSGGNFTSSILESVLVELFTLANQTQNATASSRVILTRPGISVDIEYSGINAPTLGGDNTSGYTVTIPTGTSWRVMDVEATNAAAATSNNTFSLTVTNSNPAPNVDRAIAQIKDLGSGQVLGFPQQGGITRSESINAGSVTNVFANIGALSGFAILFTR